MPSYFVANRAQADGVHAVHDRSRCPPGCFPPPGATEYLGEFSDALQACAVARLVYPQVCGCACCEAARGPAPARAGTATAAART